MNPAFVIIVLLVAILLWFLLSFVFYPLGKLIFRIGQDAIDEMNREDNKNNDNEKEKK
jgi:hypothetical protein